MACTLPHTRECCTPGNSAHLSSVCIQHSVSALQVIQNCRKQWPALETQYTTVQHQKLLPICSLGKNNSYWDPILLPGPGRQDQGNDQEARSGLWILPCQCLPFPVPSSDWRTWLQTHCAGWGFTDQGENDAVLSWEHLTTKQVSSLRLVFGQAHVHKNPKPLRGGRVSYHHVLWDPWNMRDDSHPCLIFTFFNFNNLQTSVVSTRALSFILAVNREQR